jgi:flagellar hook-basal body complex protein FliE
VIPALDGVSPGWPGDAADAAPGASAPGRLAGLFEQQMRELDGQVAAAEDGVRALAAGRPVELHDVMIALERGRLAVQTFVQVRNRLVESYQDLMRMQL